MTLAIDFAPAQEARLQQEARKAGVSVDELVRRTLAEKFPVLSDEAAQTLRFIEQWIAEAPTDPDELAEAEKDLRELQQALNQTRREAGARLLYPEVE